MVFLSCYHFNDCFCVHRVRLVSLLAITVYVQVSSGQMASTGIYRLNRLFMVLNNVYACHMFANLAS